MASIEELKKARVAKLDYLKSLSVNPYPAQTNKTHWVKDVLENFSEFAKEEKVICLAGRIMSLRAQGGLIFLDLNDGTDKIQGLLKKEDGEKISYSGLPESDGFEIFERSVDIGDIIEITGILFETKRGEKTVKISSWQMLSKTLLPLPEKWHGLQNTDERFRKRYLDILFDSELKTVIALKAKFWDYIRNFLKTENFLEVETPTLEITTGGAEAKPFKTHHNDLDLDVFLRISVGELWQKKLLASGLPRTFEIGRVYRNEGTSPNHVQEFTNVEFYASFMDFEAGLNLVEKMINGLVEEIFGKKEFEYGGHKIKFAEKWDRLDYVETIKKETGIDIFSADEKEITEKLSELGVEFEGQNFERLVDSLWKYCRKKINGPAWLVGHPKIVSPLSKSDPKDPRKVLRAQILLFGSEAGNGFAELNDPLDQRERFEIQQKLIQAGDQEAMMPDWEFVEMLEHGMPPAFGFGLGERLFALLSGKPLREIQIFPLMRPKED